MLQNVNQCEHYVVNEFTQNVMSLEAVKQLAVSLFHLQHLYHSLSFQIQ